MKGRSNRCFWVAVTTAAVVGLGPGALKAVFLPHGEPDMGDADEGRYTISLPPESLPPSLKQIAEALPGGGAGPRTGGGVFNGRR
jgi:hypothetical protein